MPPIDNDSTMQALQALLQNYLALGQPELLAFTAHQLASAGSTTDLQQTAAALLLHGYPAAWDIPPTVPKANQVAWRLLSAQALSSTSPPPPALLTAAELSILSDDIHDGVSIHADVLDGAWEARRALAPSMPADACRALQQAVLHSARGFAEQQEPSNVVAEPPLLPLAQAGALYLAARQPWLVRALLSHVVNATHGQTLSSAPLAHALVHSQLAFLSMLASDAAHGSHDAWTLAAADVRHLGHVPEDGRLGLLSILRALVRAAPQFNGLHSQGALGALPASMDALAESVAASDCEAVMHAFDQVTMVDHGFFDQRELHTTLLHDFD